MTRYIECTDNVSLIKEILKDYYTDVIFDGCPNFEDFKPDLENSIWFLLKQDEEIVGIIRLENMNCVTWIPHIVIKPEYRGNGSKEWGIYVMQYMKDRLKDVRFLILTPVESAKRYAERLGFTLLGILPKSIKRNGKLMDQYILTGSAT